VTEAEVTVPDIPLSNGVEIPQLGFGVFQIEPDDTVSAVTTALEIGYRHIDTAQGYRNEREVARAIERSGIDPSEVFVTSKLSNDHLTYDDARRAIAETVQAFGAKLVDLFLVHWPLPTVRDFMVVWRALEQAYQDGKFRAIGVSNFQVHHLDRLLDQASIKPVVNQIELHPYLTQETLRAYGNEHQVATEAWSPIAQGLILEDATIRSIAGRLGKTPAQVVLRWHIQIGNIVFPKSTTPARIRENFEIFDFELSEDDVAAINALNKDLRTGPDPDTFR
jgi:2,5-diketo-D-gluconate reductase A